MKTTQKSHKSFLGPSTSCLLYATIEEELFNHRHIDIEGRFMKTKKLQDIFERKLKQLWNYLGPLLSRFFIVTKRKWKKYHVTKVLILSALTIALGFSIYLAILARSANVNTLRVGLEQSTTIIDEQGEIAGTLYAQKGTYTDIEETSPHIIDAIISTEDQRFEKHRGFDPIGLARAAFGYVINRGQIVGGGSTITQQLAKNAYLSADQTLMRKFRELFLAIEIEKHYSKDDILEMYLNHAYFGNGVWGVEDASMKYFGKSADEVTVPEAATIAAMLKAPSRYNPIDNYERSIERRNIVLKLMTDTEVITEEEKTTYQQTELHLVDRYNSENGYRYPYYFDAVINEAVNKYDFEEEDLLNKGYTIYTSLNQTHQQQMDAAYANNAHLIEKAADGTSAQSASVALNPDTGGVTAVLGGVEGYTFRGFNRATQMRRQPGSVIKPLGVYTPALEAGYTPHSLLKDELLAYGSTEYTPTNLSGEYKGEVPMFEAVAKSYNAPTVWLLNEIGISKGARKLEQFGLTVTDMDKQSLGNISLGGMERGVSPLELASAYSVFPNDGQKVDPHFIVKIVDATGAIVVDNTSPKSRRVVSKEVAEEMNSMLLSVFENGTGQQIKPANFDVAGKTGTTQSTNGQGNSDQWIVGYTPDLVIASWMGFDKTTDQHFLTNYSSQGVGRILKAKLEMILPYTEQTTFLVEEAGHDYVEEGSTFVDQLSEGMQEAGKAIKEGASVIQEKASQWFNQFRDQMNGE